MRHADRKSAVYRKLLSYDFQNSMYVVIFVCTYDFLSYAHTLILKNINPRTSYVCNEKKIIQFTINKFSVSTKKKPARDQIYLSHCVTSFCASFLLFIWG